MSDLYAVNTVAAFWKLHADPPAGSLAESIRLAAPLLPGGVATLERGGWPGLMAHVLGEGQFGPEHWRLSAARRLYYMLKPLLPRMATPVCFITPACDGRAP